MISAAVCNRLPTQSLRLLGFRAQRSAVNSMYARYDMLSFFQLNSSYNTNIFYRGVFHEWVVLSCGDDDREWRVTNPLTHEKIILPPLIGDFETIDECLLTSPPEHPTSTLILTITRSYTILLCPLHNYNHSQLRWHHVSYEEQARSITGDYYDYDEGDYDDDDEDDDCFLFSLTCCDGKVYALIGLPSIVVQVDIVVNKGNEYVISLFSFGKPHSPLLNVPCPSTLFFLKGHREDLFCIRLDFYEYLASYTVRDVYLFKLDTTSSSMIWEEIQDLKEVFFLQLSLPCSVFYTDAVPSELGGYVHMIGGGETGQIVYSYDFKDKTISLSPASCYVQRNLRLLHDDDDGEIERQISKMMVKDRYEESLEPHDECETSEMMVKDRNEESLESHLLNIPFDVLNRIMELCVGFEYLNFRVTCKCCQLAAPMIRWSNEISVRRRLQTYSLISPWLVVLDRDRGIIMFIDPMFGDKYFKTTPQELVGELEICCSRHGWLLLLKCTSVYVPRTLFFFNPFTNDIRKLPDGLEPEIDILCFSDPPTSVDCVVVGISRLDPTMVFIHIPSSSNHSWTRFHMDFTTPRSFLCPTILDGVTYALNKGALHVFIENPQGNVFTNTVVAEDPKGKDGSYAQFFLVNCDEHHLLLVTVDEVGEDVEVFKLNDSTQQWEKIDSLGTHMIYICATTCLCMKAKTPEMENKIYFPLLHSKTGKIVFYSLETRMYHTFIGRNIQRGLWNFFGTKYHVCHAWIQPSWS